MAGAERPITDVAVGVVIDDAGQILVGQRVAGKPYAGWWEFPGGKFEAGEDAHAALVRELDEELGIAVERSDPWVVREHVYEHAHVRLHFRRVLRWRGTARGREGQAIAWCDPAAIPVAPLLPAAIATVRWLALPRRYWLSDATRLGVDPFLAAFEARIRRLAGQWAVPANRAMVLLREPGLAPSEVGRLADGMRERIRAAGLAGRLPLLASSRHPGLRLADADDDGPHWPHWPHGVGCHLTGRDLEHQRAVVASGGAPASRDGPSLLGASCHQPDDLLAAERIGADFAVYGPVLPTASHPRTAGIGWDGLAAAIALTPVPVYALGGVAPADLDRAMRAGAHGIAMQRAAWDGD